MILVLLTFVAFLDIFLGVFLARMILLAKFLPLRWCMHMPLGIYWRMYWT